VLTLAVSEKVLLFHSEKGKTLELSCSKAVILRASDFSTDIHLVVFQARDKAVVFQAPSTKPSS
jgi:hypothetical protein